MFIFLRIFPPFFRISPIFFARANVNLFNGSENFSECTITPSPFVSFLRKLPILIPTKVSKFSSQGCNMNFLLCRSVRAHFSQPFMPFDFVSSIHHDFLNNNIPSFLFYPTHSGGCFFPVNSAVYPHFAACSTNSACFPISADHRFPSSGKKFISPQLFDFIISSKNHLNHHLATIKIKEQSSFPKNI